MKRSVAKKSAKDSRWVCVEGFRWMRSHNHYVRVWALIYGERAVVRGPQGGMRKVSARALFKTEREAMSFNHKIKWHAGYVAHKPNWDDPLSVYEVKYFLRSDGERSTVFINLGEEEERYIDSSRIYKTERAAWREVAADLKQRTRRVESKLRADKKELEAISRLMVRARKATAQRARKA